MTLGRSGFAIALAAFATLVMVVGCLPFPLGDPTQAKIDPKLVGFWLNDAPEDRDLIAMYPYDDHTYLLQDQKLHSEDGKWSPHGPPIIFKAWLVDVKGHQFLGMEPLFQKVMPQEHNVYPAALVELTAGGLKVRLVNADFEALKGVKNAADQLAIVAREIENPKLFDDTQTNFRHLDIEKDKDTIEFVVKQ